ncbi:MAG TPA: Hpt domain-containing protein [Bacteroidia bacterium]|nr:Hpt domain-containing protein [Bacteroidia bacterium]
METFADLTFLKTFTAGDSEKIKKYVNLFLNGTEPALAAIKLSLETSDWKALRTAAHSLKSQTKYMGIARAEELAIFIEHNAAQVSNLDQLPEAVQNLENVISRASEELRSHIAGL